MMLFCFLNGNIFSKTISYYRILSPMMIVTYLYCMFMGIVYGVMTINAGKFPGDMIHWSPFLVKFNMIMSSSIFAE